VVVRLAASLELNSARGLRQGDERRSQRQVVRRRSGTAPTHLRMLEPPAWEEPRGEEKGRAVACGHVSGLIGLLLDGFRMVGDVVPLLETRLRSMLVTLG